MTGIDFVAYQTTMKTEQLQARLDAAHQEIEHLNGLLEVANRTRSEYNKLADLIIGLLLISLTGNAVAVYLWAIL